MDESSQEYLGDGVYASFDGYQIWLEAGLNRIALEPEVYHSLVSYKERLVEKMIEAARASE